MLSKEEIQKIANLARIEITDEEADKYSSELSEILGFVEKLNQADTDNIGPTAHITGARNATRADEIRDCPKEEKEAIIQNFPEKKDRFDKVKAVF